MSMFRGGQHPLVGEEEEARRGLQEMLHHDIVLSSRTPDDSTSNNAPYVVNDDGRDESWKAAVLSLALAVAVLTILYIGIILWSWRSQQRQQQTVADYYHTTTTQQQFNNDDYDNNNKTVDQEERAKIIKSKLKTMDWSTVSKEFSERTCNASSSEINASTSDEIDSQKPSSSLPINMGEAIGDDCGGGMESSTNSKKQQAIESEEGSDLDCRHNNNNNSSEEEEEGDNCCCICLAEFQDDDLVAISNNAKCQHFYHEECISSWLLKQEGCPTCRQNYLESDDDTDADTPPIYSRHEELQMNC